MKYFLVILALICCGCVATSDHVRKGDKKMARFAEEVAEGFGKLSVEFPEIKEKAGDITEAAEELQEHAMEDPSIKMPDWVSGVMGMVVSAVLSALGLGGVGMGLKKAVDCNNMRKLAVELTEMDREESKQHAINHKVRI